MNQRTYIPEVATDVRRYPIDRHTAFRGEGPGIDGEPAVRPPIDVSSTMLPRFVWKGHMELQRGSVRHHPDRDIDPEGVGIRRE